MTTCAIDENGRHLGALSLYRCDNPHREIFLVANKRLFITQVHKYREREREREREIERERLRGKQNWSLICQSMIISRAKLYKRKPASMVVGEANSSLRFQKYLKLFQKNWKCFQMNWKLFQIKWKWVCNNCNHHEMLFVFNWKRVWLLRKEYVVCTLVFLKT